MLALLLAAGSLGLNNFAASIALGLSRIDRGAQMTVSAARSGDEPPPGFADAGVGRLLLLAAALSIDNLVVGFALGAYRVPVALGVAVIAAVSVGLSLVDLELGARLGARVEHGSALASGIVLIGVGVAILTNLL